MKCFCGHDHTRHFASGSCKHLCPCGQFTDQSDYWGLTGWLRKLARAGLLGNSLIFPLKPYTPEEISLLANGKMKFDYQLG
jgi:hypothetical protein